MPIITAIKPQKNQKRVNIYIDDKFGFGIDLENYVALGLKVEQMLSEEDIKQVVKQAEFQKTLDKTLRFTTFRPRSQKEVRDYFKRKDVHESLHKELFNRLNRLELIDDKKFAEWWVGQRQEFKPRGTRALVLELRQKGIQKEIIEEVLENTKIDEVKIARELIEKKSYKWKNLPKREARQKKSQYLAGKGFGWDVIEKIVAKR